MSSSRLHHLPPARRRALAVLLILIAIGYGALLITTYLQVTSPTSVLPDLYRIDRLLFSAERPVGRVEQLLEASGDEIGSTMRPAFTTESTGWEELTKEMTADELATLTAAREGERAALLDWVRSGVSRDAYDQDIYLLSDPSLVSHITPDYFVDGNRDHPARVRIRTLINDRCATCHSENGRHDTARFIPLDTYDTIYPRTQPEPIRMPEKKWLLASLLALPLLGMLTSVVFWRSSYGQRTRTWLIAIPSIALGMALGSWVFGQAGANHATVILALVGVAAMGISVQAIASLSELLTRSPA